MSLPSVHEIYQMLDVTWPALRMKPAGPWTIREGAGGGKRVSAATLGDQKDLDIAQAEKAMCDLGQASLFMIQDGQSALDETLAGQGYKIIDPVTLYSINVSHLTTRPLPNALSYAVWDPLQVMVEVWAEGGIGPGRIDVMHRVQTPKTGILTRKEDTAGGVGFVAMSGDHAMIHAIEVREDQRGAGLGKLTMQHAGHWAQAQGAKTLNLAVTTANVAGNALYKSLGMTSVGTYHYRIKET